jgi:hypothetical protein
MGTGTALQKDVLDAVFRRIEALERRVADLEGQAAKPAEQFAESQVYGQQAPASESSAPSLALAGGAFAVAAKAMLGFAGAYLIRAVAESGTIPQWIGILAGLIYAVFWLVWATRQDAADRLASTLFGLTATLIFSGLVWENAVRFQQLGPSASAVIIAGFSALGMFLARTHDLPAVSGIVRAVSAVLALALLFTTHYMVPYTAAILVIAAAGEFAACHDVMLNQRWIAALAADLAILLTTWVITRPEGLPENYPAFDMTQSAMLQIALVMIYVVAMSYRTLALRTDITHFETVQNAMAIGLFLWGSVLAGREAAVARISVEGFCAVAGTLCYLVAVLFLAKRERMRNFLMYGFFGLALLMAGISILFSGTALVLAWCALAIITAWLGTHEHQMSLQLHSPVYLASAAVASGLVGFAVHALHGSAPPSGARLLEIIATTVALGLCYWLEDIGETAKARVPAALIAALLCWSLLGLGAAGITSLLGPDSFISNALRTGLICAVALALAKLAARRQECTWLIFPLMLYGGYRLLIEDFANGRPTALALSLLFYGGTLLLLTRMMRAPQTAEP